MSVSKKKSKGSEKGKKIDHSNLIEVKRKIDQLKLMDIRSPVTGNKIKELKKLIDEEPEKARKLLEEIDEKIDVAWGSWIKKKNDLVKSTLFLALDELDKAGLNTKEPRKRLMALSGESTSDDTISTDLVSIAKEIESKIEERDDLLSSEGIPALYRGLQAFENLTEKGGDLTKHKKLFKKLKKYISKGDMKNILVFSNLLYTTIQNEMGDDISKDRFKSIQDEINQMITTMEDFRRYGLGQDSIEKEIKKLRSGVDASNFSEVQSTLNRLTKNISRTEKEFFRRKGSVALLNADDLVQEYGSIIDLGPYKERTDSLKEGITTRPPRKFMEESQSVLADIKNILYENFKSQVDERFSVIDHQLDNSLYLDSSQREQMGVLRNSIMNAMENRNITEAMEYLSLAESQFGINETEGSMFKARERCMSLLDNVEGLVVEDIEIENLNEQLSELESKFLDDDLETESILEEISKSEALVNQRKMEIRTNDFHNQKDEIISMLDSIDMGPDKRSEILSSLEEAERMLSEVEEEGYRNRMLSIRSDLNSEVSSYYRDNFGNLVSGIKESVSELGLDGDISMEIKERIDDAGERFREQDYLTSGNILMEVNSEINDLIKSRELKEAEDLINSAEFMFKEAERAGVEISDQSDMLSNAKEMLRSGDIEGSRKLASSIESSVKSRWMESKRDLLREDINGLKDIFIESSELGLDIESARSLLDDAESFFEEERFEEVNDRVYRAKESLEEKRKEFFSNGSMEAISGLKSEIRDLNELGLNTVEAETLIVEAEKLFMEEDYEASYSLSLEIKDHLNFTKESYMKEDVPEKIEGIAKRVGKLEMMDLDMELARSYLDESTVHFDSGDLMGTLEDLQKAEEITNEIYRSHISLTIPETIVDVQKEVESAMEEGLEISGIKELLDEAEEMFNEEEYDLALDKIQMARENFDTSRKDFYKERYVENLNEVESIIGDGNDLDSELDLSRDNINIARDAYESGDFETSNRLMEKIKNYLERSIVDKESSQRREIVQTYFNEVKTLLAVAEAENIDLSEERNLFRIAGDLLADGDFDQAEHVLEGIKAGINDKRVLMKRRLIESSIQTTEILLQNMNEMGVDTTREYSLIEQVKEALRRGDLDLCDRINTQLQQTLHKNRGPYMVKKVQNDISEMKEKVVDLKARGMDVAAVQRIISRANDLFEKGDLQGSEEMITRGQEMVDEIQKEYDSNLYNTVLNEVNEAIGNMMNMGIPIDDDEELISISRDLFSDDKTDDAISILETALAGAYAKINTFQSTTAEGYITQIESYLDELREKEVDISNIVPIFEEGKHLHRNGEDGMAIKKFSSILELGEELRDLKEIDELWTRLSRQKALYEDLVEIGMKKSSKISKLIEQVEKGLAMESVDKEEMTRSVDDLEKILSKKTIPLKRELIKKHISDARTAIKEMKVKNVDTDILKTRIKESAELLRKGDLRRADDVALSTIEEIERIGLVETENQLREEVASVRQMLTRLKTLGSDVSNPEKLLSKAETAMLSGKTESAEKLIKSVRTSVKNIVKRNMRETAQETIEFVDAMLHYLVDNFTGVSSRLGPAESILDEARNLFKGQKFKVAKTKAEEAKDFIEDLDLPNISQFFYVFQSSQAKEMSRNVEIGISELQNKGIDTSKVRLLFDKAQEHFSSDEFERGRQMITLAKIMLAEIDQQSVRENAFDELNNAHVDILTKKRERIDVSNAYRMYNNAKEAFSMREYKKAILLAKKASYLVSKG